ncbi:hypothetical protein JCM4814A_39220 [Streptomyces phaeofaciens JCM 4814]|uniref:Secreted protein n=1 Tax=Streptomyces phaeofaciens TaxID=68254 RepID=A0A918HDN5_9ACTN|nr:hypothetical protein [Streptomyces phaeofaciens]GGT53438.1 hypothetical protein GCM10010226_33180 [Streptomyces phaeofaciens]
MRRTASFLSVVALAGALLAAAGPVASADPAAEVSPGSVDPGGSVTVSVACDPLGGTAPETIDASSLGFEDGTVRLTRVPGGDDAVSGPAYSGTARSSAAAGQDADEGVGPDTAWTVDGSCPAPPGGQGSPWSATFDMTRPGGGTAQPCTPAYGDTGSSCDPGSPCAHPGSCSTPAPAPRPCARSAQPHGGTASHPATCPPATVEHGVRAGTGGAFRDSVPALAAGGVLIAGALGAAVHRLWRRGSARDA